MALYLRRREMGRIDTMLTDGEKMVWAAAFVSVYMEGGRSIGRCITAATKAVTKLKEGSSHFCQTSGNPEANSMLQEMLGKTGESTSFTCYSCETIVICSPEEAHLTGPKLCGDCLQKEYDKHDT